MREIGADEVYKLEECLRALAEYHNEVSVNFRGSYPIRPFEKTLELFADSLEKGTSRIAVVEEEDRIVGFCKIDLGDESGKLDYLAVLKTYRGQGFGKMLMDWAMRFFDEQNIRRIEVKVVDGNEAVHLYEKYGFRMNAHILVRSGAILETDRLILRRYREEDLQDLYEYLSDEETVRFEPYKSMSMEETARNLEWRISTDEMIAVELKDSKKMVGNVYLGKRDFESLEIGYVFNRNYWGKGYAKESCAALIEKAFSEGVHRIFAECDPDNVGSWKLLESLGFSRESHLKQNVYFWKDDDGQPIWKDTFVYALLSPNNQNARPGAANNK